MKKWLSLVLGLALLMSLTGGMATAQGEDEPVTLVLASFYNTGSASGWDGLVAAFNEQYPQVTIEVQETGWDDYLTKLVSQLASGTSPDIIAAACNHIPKFVESNLLLSITDKIEGDPSLDTSDYFSHLLDYKAKHRILVVHKTDSKSKKLHKYRDSPLALVDFF